MRASRRQKKELHRGRPEAVSSARARQVPTQGSIRSLVGAAPFDVIKMHLRVEDVAEAVVGRHELDRPSSLIDPELTVMP